MSLVKLDNVEAGYGGAPIIKGINIEIDASDIGVIIGPNGAGNRSKGNLRPVERYFGGGVF